MKEFFLLFGNVKIRINEKNRIYIKNILSLLIQL